MAYEDGTWVYSYFLNTLLRYNADNCIFLKASQIIETMRSTVDFPFNVQAMDDATARVLGHGIYSMARSAEWYLRGELTTTPDDAEADAIDAVELIPEAVRVRFLDELYAFCLTYQDLMSALYTGTAVGATERLERLLITDSPENRQNQIVRFVRADNKCFDILFTPQEATKLSEMMAMVAQVDRP